MGPDRNAIVTPEAVAVSLDIAELGSRLGAAAIDGLIQIGLFVAFFIVLGVAGGLGLISAAGDVSGVVVIAVTLTIFWGYFPFFEEVWGGRTPGKRALGLRVIQTEGQPAGLGAVLLRNLLRPIDLIAIGPILILFTARHQRLGDLAGGTLVIRQAKLRAPGAGAFAYPPNPYMPPLDTAGLSQEEYGLIRSFLERRWKMDPGARAALAAQLAGLARAKVAGTPAHDWGDEPLLESVMASIRQRYQPQAAWGPYPPGYPPGPPPQGYAPGPPPGYPGP